MPADLEEKTDRYEAMLADALAAVEHRPTTDSPLERAATEFEEMATAYLDDGRHFREAGDPVNALAAFAYGHAWLDAGARIGIFDVGEARELFTV